MKFLASEFSVSKEYDLKLRNRRAIIAENIRKRDAIHLTLVTTFGLAYGKYSSIFQNYVTIEDLFAD